MPRAITTTQDKGITLPDNEPKRTGYRFAGWGTKGMQEWDISYAYDAGDAYNDGVDLALYALWDEVIVSPLKDTLQSLYSSAIMPDRYFTQNYMSPSWEKVSDNCYFLIKTDISNAAYNSVAFVLYKEDYTIKVKEYTDFDGVYNVVVRNILENNDNAIGAMETFALDFGIDFVKGVFADSNPVGMIIVYGYDGYSLISEWLESDASERVFSAFSYVSTNGAAHAEEFIFEFECAAGVSPSEVYGLVLSGAKKIYDTKKLEELNLDPYGNRDVALATFASSIAKYGFSSAVYDSGMRAVVNAMYGQ